jgi:16S rRNA (adenine1518-N6/adenine1519-N6)-dimethyltransferase
MHSQLTLIEDDLRSASWEQHEPYQIVGNIPYHLSGLIIRHITQLEPVPRQAILLVQKEVAQRLIATPPNLQLIGLAVQLWGTAQILRTVPANCFWPAPKVDSSLVALKPHVAPQTVTRAEREAVLGYARHFFSQRRKQMGGVLKRWRNLNETGAAALLQQAAIDPQQRPQEVTIPQWISLARALRR